MNKKIITGVDLAKKVIQVCHVKGNKVIAQQAMTPHEFMAWLATTKPRTIVFEACSTSNYWKQIALEKGHDAKLVSAKLVSQIRQNQKTDQNDALAVIQASQLAEIKFINGKTFEQQELQSIMRMRELAVKQKVSLANQLEALLMEFNIKVTARQGGLKAVVQATLANKEEQFSQPFLQALESTWLLYTQTVESIKQKEKALENSLQLHADCKKLMALEGVGIINAVNLYIQIGCGEAGTFKSGRDASACIGLTPIQYSTGGKVQMGSIGKSVKNVALRSCLVNGAMAVVQQLEKREPRTQKEAWIKQLLKRKSKKAVAVALANKTVRTAFALLTQGTEYKAEPVQA